MPVKHFEVVLEVLLLWQRRGNRDKVLVLFLIHFLRSLLLGVSLILLLLVSSPDYLLGLPRLWQASGILLLLPFLLGGGLWLLPELADVDEPVVPGDHQAMVGIVQAHAVRRRGLGGNLQKKEPTPKKG